MPPRKQAEPLGIASIIPPMGVEWLREAAETPDTDAARRNRAKAVDAAVQACRRAWPNLFIEGEDERPNTRD